MEEKEFDKTVEELDRKIKRALRKRYEAEFKKQKETGATK